MKISLSIALVLVSALSFGTCIAAEELPFTEGTVLDISSIKIKEGHFTEYMTFLDTGYKQVMEEAKKEGLILSYSVYAATAKTPQEPDLYLTVQYKNMAAMDGLNDKMAAIEAKAVGSMKQAEQKDADRESIRTVLGEEIIRELKLK